MTHKTAVEFPLAYLQSHDVKECLQREAVKCFFFFFFFFFLFQNTVLLCERVLLLNDTVTDTFGLKGHLFMYNLALSFFFSLIVLF